MQRLLRSLVEHVVAESRAGKPGPEYHMTLRDEVSTMTAFAEPGGRLQGLQQREQRPRPQEGEMATVPKHPCLVPFPPQASKTVDDICHTFSVSFRNTENWHSRFFENSIQDGNGTRISNSSVKSLQNGAVDRTEPADKTRSKDKSSNTTYPANSMNQHPYSFLFQSHAAISECFPEGVSPHISAKVRAEKQVSCQYSVPVHNQAQFAHHFNSHTGGYLGGNSDTLVPSTVGETEPDIQTLLLIKAGDWYENCVDEIRNKYQSGHKKTFDNLDGSLQIDFQTKTQNRPRQLVTSLRQSKVFFQYFFNVNRTKICHFGLTEHQEPTHVTTDVNIAPSQVCERCPMTMQSKDKCLAVPFVPLGECSSCLVKKVLDLQKTGKDRCCKLTIIKQTLVGVCAMKADPSYREGSKEKSDEGGNDGNTYWKLCDTSAFFEDMLQEILQKTLAVICNASAMGIKDIDSDTVPQKDRSPLLPMYFSEQKTGGIRIQGKESSKHASEIIGHIKKYNYTPTKHISKRRGHNKSNVHRKCHMEKKSGFNESKRIVGGSSLCISYFDCQKYTLFSHCFDYFSDKTSSLKVKKHVAAFPPRPATISSFHQSSKILSALKATLKMQDPQHFLVRTVPPKVDSSSNPPAGDDLSKCAVRGTLTPQLPKRQVTTTLYLTLLKAYPVIDLPDAQCIGIVVLSAFCSESRKRSACRSTGFLSLFLDSDLEKHTCHNFTDSSIRSEETSLCQKNINCAFECESTFIPCTMSNVFTVVEVNVSNNNTSARSYSPSFEEDEQGTESPSHPLSATDTEIRSHTGEIYNQCISNQTSSPGHKAQACGVSQWGYVSQSCEMQGAHASQRSQKEKYNHDQYVDKRIVESCSSGSSRCGRPQRLQSVPGWQKTLPLYYSKDNFSAGKRRYMGRSCEWRRSLNGASRDKTLTHPSLPCYSFTPDGLQGITEWLEDDDSNHDDNSDSEESDLLQVSSSTITAVPISPHLSEPWLADDYATDPVISSSDILCPDEEQALKQQELRELEDFIALEKILQEEEIHQVHYYPDGNINVVKKHDADHRFTVDKTIWVKEQEQKLKDMSQQIKLAAEMQKQLDVSEHADFVTLDNTFCKEHSKGLGSMLQNVDYSKRLYASDHLQILESIPEEDEEPEVWELPEGQPHSDIDQSSKELPFPLLDKQASFDSGVEMTCTADVQQNNTAEECRRANSVRSDDKHVNPHKKKALHSESTTSDVTTGDISHNQTSTDNKVRSLPDDVEQCRLYSPAKKTMHTQQSQLNRNHDCSSSSGMLDQKATIPGDTNSMLSSEKCLSCGGFESGDKSWTTEVTSVVLHKLVDPVSIQYCRSLESGVNTCNKSVFSSSSHEFKQLKRNQRIQDENNTVLSCQKTLEDRHTYHGPTESETATRNQTKPAVMAYRRLQAMLRSKQTRASLASASIPEPATGNNRSCTSPVSSHQTPSTQTPVHSVDSVGKWPTIEQTKKDTAISTLHGLTSTIKALAYRRWKKCHISDESVAAGYIVKKKKHSTSAEGTTKLKKKETEDTETSQEISSSQLPKNGSHANCPSISNEAMKVNTLPCKVYSTSSSSMSFPSEVSVEDSISRQYKKNKRKSKRADVKRTNSQVGKFCCESRKYAKDSDSTIEILKYIFQNLNVNEVELSLEIREPYIGKSHVRKLNSEQLDLSRSEESSSSDNDHRKSGSSTESRALVFAKHKSDGSADTRPQPYDSGVKEHITVTKKRAHSKLTYKDRSTVLGENCLPANEKSPPTKKSMENTSAHSLSSDITVDDEQFWSNCKVISLESITPDLTESPTNNHVFKGPPEVLASIHKTLKQRKAGEGSPYKQVDSSALEKNSLSESSESGHSLLDENTYVERFYHKLLAVVIDELDSHENDTTSVDSLDIRGLKTHIGDQSNAHKSYKKARKHQQNKKKTVLTGTDSHHLNSNIPKSISDHSNHQNQSSSSEPVGSVQTGSVADGICQSHYLNTQCNSSVGGEVSVGVSTLGMAMCPNQTAPKGACNVLEGLSYQALSSDPSSSSHTTLDSQRVTGSHIGDPERSLSGNSSHRLGQPFEDKRKKEKAEKGPVGLLGRIFATLKTEPKLGKNSQ